MNKENKMELWSIYHENTKHFPHIIHNAPLSEAEIAALMRKGTKSYPTASRIELRSGKIPLGISLESALRRRRSSRLFLNRAIPFSSISRLLELSYGISGYSFINTTRGETYKYGLRTAPSAGALFSCELYLAAVNVKSLKRGTYHYSPGCNDLEILALDDDLGTTMNESIIDAAQFHDWAASLIITGTFGNAITKYGERGYRYVLLDAGHVGQNIYLVANALNLGVVGVCGFYDDKVNDVLFLDGQDESALYMLLLGQTDTKKRSTSTSSKRVR
jgi:SagB-type dehydrogenase family enzyme